MSTRFLIPIGPAWHTAPVPPNADRWIVALMCFGLALVAIAVLLYANHPEWF